MLNYIWAGLIVSSFVFALGYDIRDISADRYRNGRPLPVSLSFPRGYDSAARRVPIEIWVDSARYAGFYGVSGGSTQHYTGYLLQSREGIQIRFEKGAGFPEPLASARQLQGRTFCHLTLGSRKPLVIDDTMADATHRAVPTVTGGFEALSSIPGSPPDLVHLPPGCKFHPRCPFATDK